MRTQLLANCCATYVAGTIDEVAVHNVALAASVVSDHHQPGRGSQRDPQPRVLV